MIRTVFAGLGAVAFLVAESSALAQGKPPPQEAASGGLPVGPLTVYPGVNLAQGHDDNLFLQPGNGNVKSSSFTVLSPYLRMESNPGRHKFEATLRLDEGRYWSSRSDDYTDYSFLANGDMVFSGRAGLTMRVGAVHGHEARGSTDRPTSLHPDEYDNYGADGIFRYGASGARGRIEVDTGRYARRYTNNRQFTAASDRDTSQFGGTFYWRVAPRTELLVQAQRRWIDYQAANSTQNSSEDRFYLGAKWDATAATTGYAKFGKQRKDFESALLPDQTDSSWDVGVRWSPRTYSVFDFSTSRQTVESTGIGNFTDSKRYGVIWNHAWNSRLRTQALVNYFDDDFIRSVPARVDKTTQLGAKVFYDFRRWLRFGAEYTYWDRGSSLSTFEYRRNVFLLTMGVTL